MDIFILLQTETVLAKSAEMAQKDPYGWIITVVSISVVFVSLALLFILYYLIGRIANRLCKEKQPQTTSAVEDSTIAEPEDSELHDKESYMITIRSKDQISISSLAPMASRTNTESDVLQEGNQEAAKATSGKEIIAPLPGVITAIKVKAGDIVKNGQTVAVLEAMKMENDLLSEVDGTVRSVNVEKGDSVLEGAVIITLG